MKDRIDIEFDMLRREINVTRANINLCNEALFWLSVAQIYLDSKTLSGISESERICECVEKMRLK